MDHLIRLWLSFVTTIASVPVWYWAIGEIHVRWYMATDGISVRADLSEDYGLGMSLLAIDVPLTAILAIASGIFVWRQSLRFSTR